MTTREDLTVAKVWMYLTMDQRKALALAYFDDPNNLTGLALSNARKVIDEGWYNYNHNYFGMNAQMFDALLKLERLIYYSKRSSKHC